MDSKDGGLSPIDRQRKAAAQIARRRVLNAYAKANKLKNEPVKNEKVQSGDWRRYHSAWQNYYQKYYSDYYSHAALDYVAKEKLKLERKAADEEAAFSEASLRNKNLEEPVEKSFSSPDGAFTVEATTKEKIERKIRKVVRKNASDAAQRARRRRRWTPVLAGLTVTLVILFLQYNRLIFAPIAAYVSPSEAPDSSIEAVDPTVTGTISAESKLIIPKINVEVPVTFGTNSTTVIPAMENGVAQYLIKNASAYPGEIGNMVITGHSAGDVYSDNKYKYVFSGLERLEVGDLIYVNYKSTRYVYRMTGSKVVEPTDVAALQISTSKPMLTLVTCTPLGTSRYRLLVFAEQISPNYDDAPTAEQVVTEESEEDVELPSNEKTFFERIWDFLSGNA